MVDLSLEEFVRVICNMEQVYTLEMKMYPLDPNDENDVIMGTYSQLYDTLMDVLGYCPDNTYAQHCIEQLKENLFDYKLEFTELDIYDYLDEKTKGFQKERCLIFLRDLKMLHSIHVFQDGYSHDFFYLKAVKWLEEKIEITASKNINTPLPTEIESEQPSHTQIQEILLPEKLNTPRARKYFSKAIDANIITKTDTGYSMGSAIKTKALLAYFIELVFCRDEAGKDNGIKYPGDASSLLFGTTRLEKARSQYLNNKGKNPKGQGADYDGGKPGGYKIIDKIFIK